MIKSALILIFSLISFYTLFSQSGIIIYKQYENGKPNLIKMYFDKDQSISIWDKGKKEKILRADNGEVIDTENDEKFMAQIAKYPTFYEYYTDEEGQCIYKNWKSNSLVQREIVRKNACIIKEPKLPKQKWELTNESKKIGKFNCQKAKTNFRGRKYEVWFTTEIPIPSGPWKLQGLPGLILEASDDSKKYIYTFQSIEMPLKDTKPLTLIPTKGQVIQLKEYPNFFKLQEENWKREVESKAAERGEKVIVTLSKEPKQEIEYEQ
jgi:GLPGLI family protein